MIVNLTAHEVNAVLIDAKTVPGTYGALVWAVYTPYVRIGDFIRQLLNSRSAAVDYVLGLSAPPNSALKDLRR